MRKILVTGANRGIGLAMVREFLATGEFVLAVARHPERSGELRQIREGDYGDRLKIYAGDLASEESLQSLAREITSFPGQLDTLVNNAGVFPEEGTEPFGDLDLGHLETAWQVNVRGTLRLTQLLLPLLGKGHSPTIVNVSSGAASISTKDHSRQYCYGLTKAALNHFTRGLAAELRSGGITVVAISPGWVRTDMGGDQAEITAEESAQAMVRTTGKLTLAQSGEFLDRHGKTGVYAW
ncbi:MAG: SDR family NAD(P)-dependent oxidoreductase [Opitutales bacterium]|nr:SDR family NAD(P)-dependent oxidoreductase [Opitutales bacterium]